MARKLQRDALRADRAAVEALIADAHDGHDPVGEMQFRERLQAIDQELAVLDAEPEPASVGLFFGGTPVMGSRGIRADFAADALDSFQELVAKSAAVAEFGQLGQRGPVPGRATSALMISDVLRGSFGFLLTDDAAEPQLVESPVANAIDHATTIITKLASPDQAVFDEAMEGMESRLLAAANSFFKTLDDAGANIRIVEQDREATLTYSDIQRAHQRTEETRIEDNTHEFVGVFYAMPKARRFELWLDNGDAIIGSIDSRISAGFQNELQQDLEQPLGRRWRARVQVREVHARNREVRKYYTLMGLIQPES